MRFLSAIQMIEMKSRGFRIGAICVQVLRQPLCSSEPWGQRPRSAAWLLSPVIEQLWQAGWYGLDLCPCPNLMLNCNPQCWRRRWLDHGKWSFMNSLVPFSWCYSRDSYHKICCLKACSIFLPHSLFLLLFAIRSACSPFAFHHDCKFPEAE